MPTRAPRRPAVVAALAICVCLVVTACGGDEEVTVRDVQREVVDPGFDPDAEDAPYVGDVVVLEAEVAEVVSPWFLTLSAGDLDALPVLHDQPADVEPGGTVRVTGPVSGAFGLVEAEAFVDEDLTPSVYQQWADVTYVQARTVEVVRPS